MMAPLDRANDKGGSSSPDAGAEGSSSKSDEPMTSGTEMCDMSASTRKLNGGGSSSPDAGAEASSSTSDEPMTFGTEMCDMSASTRKLKLLGEPKVEDDDERSSGESTADTTNDTAEEADDLPPGYEQQCCAAADDEDEAAAAGSELLEEWYDGEDGENIYPRALEASAMSDDEEDDGEGALSTAERQRAVVMMQRPSMKRLIARRKSTQHKTAAAAVSDKKLFRDIQGKMRETGLKTEVGLAQLLSDPEKLKAVEEMVERHKSREEAVKAFDESLDEDLRSAGFARGGKGLLGTLTRGVGNLGASIMDAVPGGGGATASTHRRPPNESENSGVGGGGCHLLEPASALLPALADAPFAPLEHEESGAGPDGKGPGGGGGAADKGRWWRMRPLRGSQGSDVPRSKRDQEQGELLPKDSVSALLTGDRPYVRLPSRAHREMALLQALMVAASGQDGPSLVSICGAPYVGKSRLLREVLVESDHVEMAGVAVLRSYRTELDGGTSYFPLRQIVASALRLCDAKCGGGGGDMGGGGVEVGGGFDLDDLDAAGDGDDVVEIFTSDEDGACAAVERLVASRVLTASDMLALGLVLPELGRTGEASRLLATLQGQSPASLAKSVADALLKVLTPLQPLAMLWEGDGELDSCTKSVLSEMMKSAKERCPRMLVAIESRRPVTLPYGLLDEAQEIRLTALAREETEIFLRSALSLDGPSANGEGEEGGMTDISEKLLDTVHDRSAGCPLFIDRLAAWSVEREMIRRDTERDVVVLSLPPSSSRDDSAFHAPGASSPSHGRSAVEVEVDEDGESLASDDENDDDDSSEKLGGSLSAIPCDLSDMVLEAFNDLPPHLWDAMKMAACIGPAFNAGEYESLSSSCHGGGIDDSGTFMDHVRELESEHGVFERRNSARGSTGGTGGRSGRYKWKRREVFEAVSSVVISNERKEIHGAIVDMFDESCHDQDAESEASDENDSNQGDDKPTGEAISPVPAGERKRRRRRTSSVLLARHSSLASRWDVAFGHYIAAAAAAEIMMKFTEAEVMYRKAIECWETAAAQQQAQGGNGGKDAGNKDPSSGPAIGDGEYLRANIKLGNCLRELAQFKEAEEVLTTCLEVATESRKENDEQDDDDDDAKSSMSEDEEDNEETYLHALASLARLHQNQSKYVTAQELYEKALPIARSKRDSQPGPWLAGHIAGYAEILRKSGELKRAEELHLEALELRQTSTVKVDGEADGGDSSELELAVSYTQLGCTVAGLGRPKEAQEYHSRALASRLGHLGLSHALVSESLNYGAEALHKLGRSKEGVALGVHAVRIRRKAFGPSHPAYAHALSVLASCYHGVGRSCDAQTLLEECIGVCEKAFSAEHANMIPNLMAYGEVLRAMNKNGKATRIYERAASIHRANFKNGQRAGQLQKCESNIAELSGMLSVKSLCSMSSAQDEDDATVGSASNCKSMPRMRRGVRVPIPPVDTSAGGTGTPIIVLTDVGEHPQDEYLLVLLASLRQVNLLNPLGVVASLQPQRKRASLARGVLDALGLPDVPVATGSSSCCSEEEGGTKPSVYDTDYARSCSCIAESGVDLMVRALKSSPDSSVQLLCAASLTDVWTLIRDYEELFVQKVKEVTIMGSLKPLESFNFLAPVEEFGHKRDMSAAEQVYEKCQELGFPTLTVAEAIVDGCPFSSAMIEDLSKTEHMVSTSIRSNCEASMNSLWKEANTLPPDTSGDKTGKRRRDKKRINALWKNLPFSDRKEEQQPTRRDRKWFCQKFFGSEESPHDMRSSIWSSINSMDIRNCLALLSCVATYRDTRFEWETKDVDGTAHRITGASREGSGIVCSDALPQELSMLLQLAFQSAMQNMMC